MMMMMSPASAAASASASTDCSSSSMQGSTTSSASSDVMTLTTTAASSWCAMPASTRLRVVRLVRPHQRRLLVVPERSAAFGFAVRGGKEHGIGFFVSHVEHGGEAQLKGLRIGDQILRINGYRLEDAVHKEFIQLVASQDRVTLKVRGVGMLPVKDQPDERLSWSVVKLPSVSGTPSESSFKATTDRRTASRDINVVLHVAPRTKLGLGICKGPEWKPGIFVQFTKERSVAREAGLRPGDQILSVNSIDFSDVLFSEAVAVMKGSSKLDMVVRTAAGCDLFPGESSGYNSSASSVTGDQSPCWADAKSKRLTAVREEPTQAGGAAVQHKQVNKTIIKLTENGTSINSTYIANACGTQREHEQALEQLSVSRSTTMRRSCSVAAPTPPPPAAAGAAGTAAAAPAPSSSSAGSSLSSAITEELKKRKEKQQQQLQQSPPPQPPAQLKLSIPNGSGNSNGNGNGQPLSARSKQLSSAPASAFASASPLSPVRSPNVQMRAPAMPQPDYDAATAAPANGTQQRRTLRLGTVTIGEYSGEQRSKREMLRSTNAGSAQTNGILKNGNRSSNSFSTSNGNSSSSSNSRQQQQQQQQPEKSIKFGN
ncbi:PREDICTED: whirlin isoform X2 [Drosophila arizonae]|uniref:Whirlin isoform X2 n=1 Tax=Drosophila arizonae TaxID=7263 RepID=A0ABM1PT11_DROAR|nr:PREDICTED: whirlin isoform X2 [Drosophila arizonae]